MDFNEFTDNPQGIDIAKAELIHTIKGEHRPGQTWEKTTILGDGALAKLLKKDRQTVIRWRRTGKITARPIGEKSDGVPMFYAYDWEAVKLELKYGPKGEKIK